MSLEIFYDGACAFCSRTAERIRQMDSKNAIVLTDITVEPWAPELVSISLLDAQSEIHGTDGRKVYSGYTLVLKIIEHLGYPKTAKILGLPIIRWVGLLGYKIISRFRKWL